jgi:hypothetical protein
MRNVVRTALILSLLVGAFGCSAQSPENAGALPLAASELKPAVQNSQNSFDDEIHANVTAMAQESKRTFCFDTFGDEVFWGDRLKLHRAIIGEKLGGVGPGVSPRTALSASAQVAMYRLSSLNRDGTCTPLRKSESTTFRRIAGLT